VITKMQRGTRTRGLVEYLFGPGRAEEHTNQRIVAAWEPAWEGITHPDEVQRALLTAEVDAPVKRMPEVAKPAEHVYHVSISNHGEDRILSDEEWATVARAVADKLGLSGTDTQEGARWFAVHHGAASGDRDHIHFVATLVREDGRGIYLNKDKLALREVAKEMQARFGLEVRTREPGAGVRELSRPELAATLQAGEQRDQQPGTPSRHSDVEQQQPNRTGEGGAVVEPVVPVEVPRRRLERAVRAAASAASTEAQWLARLGELGVEVAPRWARGGDRVVGYRVALTDPPTQQAGSKAVWFGGGKLAHDLTLPALRAGWTRDGDPATAWRRATTPAPAPAPDPAPVVLGQGHHHTAAPTSTGPGPEDLGTKFTAATTTMRGAMFTAREVGSDGAAVARAARDTAGLLAAIAEHAPPADQRRLVAASAHLARAGQVAHGQPRGARSPLSTGFAQVAATVLTAASGGTASTAVLLAQVARLTRTVAELHAVQHRVAAAHAAAHDTARDTARAVDLLAPYTARTARTPVAPTPVAVPPTPVLMPNQEQLDEWFGNTLEERKAQELRDIAQENYQFDEPSTYRAPPPTQDRGRER
jgi:hypothetical protein